MKIINENPKEYLSPAVWVIEVTDCDVITTSGGGDGWDLPEIPITGSVSDLD